MNADDFLRRRKDRACAIVLTVVDREIEDKQTREHIRKAILDQINDFYNATIDVVHSLDSGTVVLNELWLAKLDEISGLIRNGVR